MTLSPERWSFGLKLAGVFNWVAALIMFVMPGALVANTNLHFLFRLVAMFVAIFGYMYWQAGEDLRRTDYVWFGLIGKAVGVGIIWSHTFAGTGSTNLSLLAVGDLPFVIFFACFLWRKPD